MGSTIVRTTRVMFDTRVSENTEPGKIPTQVYNHPEDVGSVIAIYDEDFVPKYGTVMTQAEFAALVTGPIVKTPSNNLPTDIPE